MKKQKKYNVTLVLLIVLLLFVIGALACWYLDYAHGDISYEAAKENYTDEDTVDLEALQAKNPDIRAWIRIDGTNIDYPVLWSGNDNDYLRHTYSGDYNVLGSIFIWQKNHPDFSDRNTLVFGHNTWNGQMFGQLRKYKKQSFFEEHPTITIYTPSTKLKYKIVAAYLTTTDSNIYTASFEDEQQYADWLNDKLQRSVIDTKAEKASGTEQTIVLSTCAKSKSNQRFVVVAEKVNSEPTV